MRACVFVALQRNTHVTAIQEQRGSDGQCCMSHARSQRLCRVCRCKQDACADGTGVKAVAEQCPPVLPLKPKQLMRKELIEVARDVGRVRVALDQAKL